LPDRFKNNWPVTPGDQKTLYGGDAKGYADYPAYQEEVVAEECGCSK
jgi:N-ethylmaleimide reductase